MASFYPKETVVEKIEETENTVKHPLKRFEPTLRTSLDIAIPTNLQRLKKHGSNIRKFMKANEWKALDTEQVNASRAVQQLQATIRELENVRNQVKEDDLKEFDKRISPMKEEAMNAIQQFVSMHNEMEAKYLRKQAEKKVAQSSKLRDAEPLENDCDKTNDGPVNKGNPVSVCGDEPKKNIESSGPESICVKSKQEKCVNKLYKKNIECGQQKLPQEVANVGGEQENDSEFEPKSNLCKSKNIIEELTKTNTESEEVQKNIVTLDCDELEVDCNETERRDHDEQNADVEVEPEICDGGEQEEVCGEETNNGSEAENVDRDQQEKDVFDELHKSSVESERGVENDSKEIIRLCTDAEPIGDLETEKKDDNCKVKDDTDDVLPCTKEGQVQECIGDKKASDSWTMLKKDLIELKTLVKSFGTKQEEDETDVEVDDQLSAYLEQANKYKNAVIPFAGAIVGGLIGGPIGLMAGFKLTGAVAVVGGGIAGFTGGELLNSVTIEEKTEEDNEAEKNESNEEDTEKKHWTSYFFS